MTEKTINIIGKDVRIRYCAAAETGFENLSGKSINEINPTSQRDFLMLSVAAIIAAYSRNNEEPPISSNELLYDAKPEDITKLITTVIELRAAWYNVPKIVDDAIKEDQEDLEESEKEKNA